MAHCGYERLASGALLHPEESSVGDVEILPWLETEDVGVSRSYLLYLTISMGGLQVVWATVMAEGSTFLLSLGLRTWHVSLVWLAGPISGTLLQPYIGYRSDFCVHPWGRRRPFMIYGAIATITCINLLAWISETVRTAFYVFGVAVDGCAAYFTVQVLAIASIWALNIAIQPVQASIRALIIDSCPAKQAAQANRFASIAVVIGSAVGYGCGFLGMPTSVSWLENPQFKGLCLIASVSLGATVAITSTLIEEKVARLDENTEFEKRGVRQIWIEILDAIRTLPPTIKQVCIVQFFSWLAWFPFLFNIVIYLSKQYEQKIIMERGESSGTRHHQYKGIHEESTQHAVLAMLGFALVALLANLSLPYIISSPYSRVSRRLDVKMHPRKRFESALKCLTSELLQISWLTLPRAWMCSHILTAIFLLGGTWFGGFTSSASFVSFLGIPWALTQWAPFAIITVEIARDTQNFRDFELKGDQPSPSSSSSATDAGETLHGSIELIESQKVTSSSQPPTLRSRTGTTMGVHNIAIALPQMLSAVVSSLIYWICKRMNVGDRDAMAWVLRVGILAAVIAAYSARSIRSHV